MAGLYETWATHLRLAWMGVKASRIWGAFAAVLGDYSAAWARRATLEHFPEEALDPTSLALTGSERQLDQGIGESDEAYAQRLTKWRRYWKLAGHAKGLLLQLYLLGLRDAVIVQQNGVFFRLPTIMPADPLDAVIVKGDGPELIAPLTSHVNPSRTPIPEGTPWYAFDGDIEHCSRFAVLLPTQPTWWRHQGVATFDNSDTATVTWSRAFPSSAYNTLIGALESDDFALLSADPAGYTTTGATITASGPITGTAGVLAYAAGENPLCCPSDETLAQLRRVINLWRPKKALCIGIYALVRGRWLDYPTVAVDGSTDLIPSEIAELEAA